MNVAEVEDAADHTKGYHEDVEKDAEEVPKFTAEEEMREKQSLTVEERKQIVADLCGLADGMAGLRVSNARTATASASSAGSNGNYVSPSPVAAEQHPPPLRTPDEIERGMNLLNAAIDAIPHDEKEAYLLAMLHCPDQVFGGWRGEVMVEMQQQGKDFDAKVSVLLFLLGFDDSFPIRIFIF